jgi:hypothetical protein
MTTTTQDDLGSAYGTVQRVHVSKHYTGVALGSPVVTKIASVPEPLGFSSARWRQGESDAASGRIQPFDDVMNALRTQFRGHGG